MEIRDDVVWPYWPADDTTFEHTIYDAGNGYGAHLVKGREDGWRLDPFRFMRNGKPSLPIADIVPEIREVTAETLASSLDAMEGQLLALTA